MVFLERLVANQQESLRRRSERIIRNWALNVEEPGIAHFVLKADGSQGNLLMLPAGGSRFPARQETIDAVFNRLKVPKDKQFSNIERYGNTSAASIYIAMYEAYQQGRLNKDDILLLVAFGGGFTYAAAVLQWHLEAPKVRLIDRLLQKI